ncbi:MAG: hypothetical protein V2A73_23120 [Pseudomonadota bacterium]
MRQSRRRLAQSRRARLRSALRISIVLGALVAMNIYVFFFRGGSSIKDIRKAAHLARVEQNRETAVGAAAAAVSARDGSAAGLLAGVIASPKRSGAARVVEGRIRKGDSLAAILVRESVGRDDFEALLRSLRPEIDFRSIRDGQTYSLYFDDNGQLIAFGIRLSPQLGYHAERTPHGSFRTSKVAEQSEQPWRSRTG